MWNTYIYLPDQFGGCGRKNAVEKLLYCFIVKSYGNTLICCGAHRYEQHMLTTMCITEEQISAKLRQLNQSNHCARIDRRPGNAVYAALMLTVSLRQIHLNGSHRGLMNINRTPSTSPTFLLIYIHSLIKRTRAPWSSAANGRIRRKEDELRNRGHWQY